MELQFKKQFSLWVMENLTTLCPQALNPNEEAGGSHITLGFNPTRWSKKQKLKVPEGVEPSLAGSEPAVITVRPWNR